MNSLFPFISLGSQLLGRLLTCAFFQYCHLKILSIYLNRSIVPTLQGYEDSGDFTFRERLKTSIHKNMTYYAIVGAIGLFGLILIIIMRHDWYASIV